MSKQRNSSLEVIRLVCIFYVVYWHSINPYLDQMASFNVAPVNLINSLCNNTNTLFMLLSGYFGIRLNLEKLIKLDLAIIFYDVLYLILFGTIGAKSLLISLMPITFKSHWFLTCYFVIAFLSGFLNQIPEKLSRNTFRNLLLALIAIFYVLPTFVFYEIIEDSGKGVVCMTIVYLVGRYIRKYYGDISFKKGPLAIVFVVSILVPTVLNFGLSMIKGVFMGMYSRDNSIFMLISSVVFFLFFREMHFTNRLINHLTPNIVILYCIEGYVREVSGRYIHLVDYAQSPFFIFIVFGYAMAVIVFCLLLNELRTLLLDRVDSFIASHVMRVFQRFAPLCTRIAGTVSERLSAFLTVSK